MSARIGRVVLKGGGCMQRRGREEASRQRALWSPHGVRRDDCRGKYQGSRAWLSSYGEAVLRCVAIVAGRQVQTRAETRAHAAAHAAQLCAYDTYMRWKVTGHGCSGGGGHRDLGGADKEDLGVARPGALGNFFAGECRNKGELAGTVDVVIAKLDALAHKEHLQGQTCGWWCSEWRMHARVGHGRGWRRWPCWGRRRRTAADDGTCGEPDFIAAALQ